MCIQVIFSGDAHNIYSGEKIVSSINDVGKTGFPHAKEQNCILIPYAKINWKCIKDLSIRSETVTLLKENIVGKLLDIGQGNELLQFNNKSEK